MKTILPILFTLILLTSCSIQRRADGALKRIGADPLLSSIKREYPGKFYTDTTPRYVTITKVDTFEVVTKEVSVDTLIRDTCNLTYDDSNISLIVKGSKLKYTIKPKIKTVVSPPKVHTIKCPDCPPVPKPPKEPIKKNKTYIWIIAVIASFAIGLLLGVKYAQK